jgi:hypothetical protein
MKFLESDTADKLKKITNLATVDQTPSFEGLERNSYVGVFAPKIKPNSGAVVRRSSGITVRVSPKEIMVGRNYRMVDPQELISMIRNITQSIGEYKAMNNAYGDFVIGGMRKIRRDIVAQLESNFRIHWRLDDDGNSIFYLL